MYYFRSISFRISACIVCLTLVSLFLLAVLVTDALGKKFELRIENGLIERHEITQQLLQDNESDYIDNVISVVRLIPAQYNMAFELIDGSGNHITGNVTGLKCEVGFKDVVVDTRIKDMDDPLPIVDSPNNGDESVEIFRFLVKPVEEGCLAFGRSLYEQIALQDSVRQLIAWALPLCLLPVLFVSFWFARRLSSRLIDFADVVKKVGDGDLAQRLKIQGDDEIDQLAVGTNRSFDRLQDSVESLQQLSSSIAHDLRAPLSRLSMPLEAAIVANESGTVAPDILHEVQQGISDMRETFDALLRITQIESGHRRSGFTRVDISELVESLREIYQPVCEDANIAMESASIQSPIYILGDAELIQQAVINLIANSINYCQPKATIRMKVEQQEDAVTLSVEDNGPGIAKAEHERVFRRLYRIQTKEKGKAGTGLGLSLVRAVVELHNGVVKLSDARPGLCVKIFLNRMSV